MSNNLLKVNVYFVLALLWALSAFPWPSHAGEAISIHLSKREETITLSVPDARGYKVFTLANPHRLVVDVPAFEDKRDISLPASYRGPLVRSVRFARFNPETSRFVFDLNESVGVLAVMEESKGQLSVRIAPGRHTGVITGLKAAKPQKPVVVIDAGHGGQDPGARGRKGTLEKQIVLEYARKLQARLLKSGRYKVVMTREGDRYIPLRERVRIAREAKGGVFISLHADSAPDRGARGLSVYTVSEKASDQEAEALAARENKSDVIAGIDLSTESEDVAGILISLAQRETKNNSAMLADLLVIKLDEKVKLLDNTHRFAGFAVLKAPDIPSVLIEIGFLSNPAEEKLLNSKSYRDKVIAGIEAGIDMYFRQQRAASVE